jgi:GTP cyclohydrolase IIa
MEIKHSEYGEYNKLTVQLSVIRIDGYGLWTTTLGTDRESHLQMLQAKIYYDIQRLFSQRDCIAYSNRFDEFFAVTNCLSIQDHMLIELELANTYPNLKMSMAIGSGDTPYKANLNAYEARRSGKLLVYGHRIFGENLNIPSDSTAKDNYVKIMHIDIDGSSTISNQLSPYEITSLVIKIYSRLSDEFLKINSLTFFLGGDNFMVISNGVTDDETQRIINEISMDLKIKLNCGIGIARTGKGAAEASTRALDTIRDMRKRGKVQPIYEIQCL